MQNSNQHGRNYPHGRENQEGTADVHANLILPPPHKHWLPVSCARKCDFVSAVVSLLLFVTVIVMWINQPRQVVQVWDENILILDDAKITTLVQDSIGDYCNTSKILQQSGMHYNERSRVVVPLSLHAYTLVVWPFLAWVFFCSFLFQAYRSFLRFNSDADGGGLEDGPDFWRWVEYALTSPCQIFIIATSFWIGEQDLLLTMCSLQGALVLTGYVIELEVDKVIESFEDKFSTRWPRSLTRVHLLLFASWFFHGALWFVIIRRFYSQAHNADDCQNPMPNDIYNLVSVIVWGEFGFFSGFGLVVVYQVGYLTSAVFWDTRLHNVRRGSFRHEFWLEATVAYYSLSCAAKTLLGVCFVALVLSMPSADDHGNFPKITNTPPPPTA